MRRYQVARPVGVLVRLLYTARLSYCSSCNTRARVLTAQCALLASAAVCHPRCRRSIDRISARPAPTLAFFPPSPTCDVTGWPRPRRSIRVPASQPGDWLVGWSVDERGEIGFWEEVGRLTWFHCCCCCCCYCCIINQPDPLRCHLLVLHPIYRALYCIHTILETTGCGKNK